MHLRRSVRWPLLMLAVGCSFAGCGGQRAGRVARRPPDVSGIAESSNAVAITSHSAYWASVLGIGIDGDCVHGAGLFVIRGELQNGTRAPLGHVKLAYELLDRAGRVVAVEEGYNRNSEMLRPLDSPIPWELDDPPQVPIPTGGTDTFRMLFLQNETPPFASYRIRVVESAAR